VFFPISSAQQDQILQEVQSERRSTLLNPLNPDLGAIQQTVSLFSRLMRVLPFFQLEKLPKYTKKLANLKKRMQNIDKRVQKLTKETNSLHEKNVAPAVSLFPFFSFAFHFQGLVSISTQIRRSNHRRRWQRTHAHHCRSCNLGARSRRSSTCRFALDRCKKETEKEEKNAFNEYLKTVSLSCSIILFSHSQTKLQIS
jgi:hypothetical protein